MLNKVCLIGRLGSLPEVKTLTNGQTVANMSIATSEKWVDRDGKTQERTEWHRVNAWGKLAEACEKHLNKGSLVYLEGKLQTRSWEDQGTKKFITEVVASSVKFLESTKKDGEGMVYHTDGNDDFPF